MFMKPLIYKGRIAFYDINNAIIYSYFCKLRMLLIKIVQSIENQMISQHFGLILHDIIYFSYIKIK